MKTLITLSLLLFGSLLTAQNVRVAIEGGINRSDSEDLGYTFGGSAEYAFPLDSNTSLILGAGYQRLNYEKTPVSDEPWECPGDCIFNFRETENYTMRSSDIMLNIGLERRFGKWSARLTASPVLRVDAKLSAHLITIPDLAGRPLTEIEFTAKPGEEVLTGRYLMSTLDYDKDFYLQLGLGAGYAVTSQLTVGLAYRRMLSKYEVIYANPGCGFANCFIGERTRFDARIGSLLATVRYSF